ncbi:MAG: NAD(P)H-dependent oxidoreductase [Candidatus Bathyarchaeia archaeon]
MDRTITILGFAGSLRKDSLNKAVLRAALELTPPGAKIKTFDLEGIPPFNQDLEADPPKRVKEFKEEIKVSDAILIATPEYNYSMPGVLKNAIDWASRPYGDNAFDDKPVAVFGASVGLLGTARAQYHLRQVFVFLNMHPLNYPEVMIPRAHEKIDQNGRLVDEEARESIRRLIETLVTWTKRIKRYP